MTSTLKKISQEYSSLTRAHQRVAAYVLKHFSDVAFMTLERTASGADVSTTSVIRFARQLGYEGFSDFQRQIQQDLKIGLLTEPLKKNYERIPREALLIDTFKNDIVNIERTLAELDENALHLAVSLIVHARHIYVFGLRDSLAIAHYLYSRLVAIRPRVYIPVVSPAGMTEDLLSLEEGDLCITCAFPYYTSQTIDTLKEIKSSPAKSLIITAPNHEMVAHLGDVFLSCHVTGNSIKNTYAAVISLVNYLANAVIDDDYEMVLSHSTRAEELLNRNHVLWLDK